MLEVGLTLEQTQIVTDQLTAANLGSGALPVYGTPYMIAFMEATSRKCVQPHLDEGCGTVGTMVNVKHLAASPVGMTITCRATLIEVDRRRLMFRVEAYDNDGLIGEGTHERFVINNDKFMQKTTAKLSK
ncbi:MAG: thioesterase family protein [Clostridia bacterium]|nr:thioesterase family protein [Clostridia bacterium]